MFNPTRDQARLFFLNSWKKYHKEEPLTEAESLALQWMTKHPEYLSMHLAVAEQVSIDQPPGIRAAFAKLCEKMGDDHKAAHQVFECLAEQIYQQQKNGVAFSSENYIPCILEHSGV